MQAILISVAVVPVVAGTLRLIEVFGGPRSLPDNPRIAASPAPAVLHIVGGGVFLVLGAFQFSAPIRRRWPTWHRRVGRVLLVLALGAAVAAVDMTLLYPLQTGTGQLLHLLRLLFGSALAACVVLGFREIGRASCRERV